MRQASVPRREAIVGPRRPGAFKHETIDGYLFISPWLLGFLFFTVGPMIASIYLSFTEWNLLLPARWVGLANFAGALKDDVFWLSLYNTAYYTFLSVPLHLLASLLLAVMLNVRIHGTRFYRTLYYIPSITPVVASSILWIWFFNPTYGVANAILKAVGLPPQMWFFDTALAKPTFVLISLWGIGQSTIIILAGLQGVPQELYEAAEMDGAGTWNKFWNITWPMISPTTFFVFIMAIIGGFQGGFMQAYIMTGGGPDRSTTTLEYLIYNHLYSWQHVGYAASIAWFVFVIIFIITLFNWRFGGRLVQYYHY